jgi:hypothetical protein
MLLRLPYLALTSVFAFIRLLPMSDVDENVEILALRHRAPRGATNRVGVKDRHRRPVAAGR